MKFNEPQKTAREVYEHTYRLVRKMYDVKVSTNFMREWYENKYIALVNRYGDVARNAMSSYLARRNAPSTTRVVDEFPACTQCGYHDQAGLVDGLCWECYDEKYCPDCDGQGDHIYIVNASMYSEQAEYEHNVCPTCDGTGYQYD